MKLKISDSDKYCITAIICIIIYCFLTRYTPLRVNGIFILDKITGIVIEPIIIQEYKDDKKIIKSR